MSDDRYIAFEEKIGISEVLSSIREWLGDYKANGYEEHKELKKILENPYFFQVNFQIQNLF